MARRRPHIRQATYADEVPNHVKPPLVIGAHPWLVWDIVTTSKLCSDFCALKRPQQQGKEPADCKYSNRNENLPATMQVLRRQQWSLSLCQSMFVALAVACALTIPNRKNATNALDGQHDGQRAARLDIPPDAGKTWAVITQCDYAVEKNIAPRR